MWGLAHGLTAECANAAPLELVLEPEDGLATPPDAIVPPDLDRGSPDPDRLFLRSRPILSRSGDRQILKDRQILTDRRILSRGDRSVL
jgi:hypothetical protein